MTSTFSYAQWVAIEILNLSTTESLRIVNVQLYWGKLHKKGTAMHPVRMFLLIRLWNR